MLPFTRLSGNCFDCYFPFVSKLKLITTIMSFPCYLPQSQTNTAQFLSFLILLSFSHNLLNRYSLDLGVLIKLSRSLLFRCLRVKNKRSVLPPVKGKHSGVFYMYGLFYFFQIEKCNCSQNQTSFENDCFKSQYQQPSTVAEKFANIIVDVISILL